MWSRGQSLKNRILSDPFYRFQSITEINLAAELGIEIDANQATVDDWLRLPGISIHQARSLVQLSQSGVYFYSLDDVAAALSVSVNAIKPFSAILKFYYRDPESEFTPQLLNPNTASLEQLDRLSGIHPQLPQTILQNRQMQGPFRNIADLQRRLALPGDMVSQLMHYLRF